MENFPNFLLKLFDEEVELLPNTIDLFELKLAYWEYYNLKPEERLNRLAYFKSVNNVPTKHYTSYKNLNRNQSAYNKKKKEYFDKGKFSTGYGVHSLFPYKGKFHPQMIKSFLNILNLNSENIVLDPFCGSGTTNIEAAELGIDSYGIDVSPFCNFMCRTKYETRLLTENDIADLDKNHLEKFSYFSTYPKSVEYMENIENDQKRRVYQLLLLAYLDSLGFFNRTKGIDHEKLFLNVLRRYKQTVMQNIKIPLDKYGNLTLLDTSNAKSIELADNSIDAIITSPPYSFAIDYINNDLPQLKYLGTDFKKLSNEMVGLKGSSITNKLEIYLNDMGNVFGELSRVLKPNKYLILVIGSNTDQTGGVKLDQLLIKEACNNGMDYKFTLEKPIHGIQNTMESEQILFFKN